MRFVWCSNCLFNCIIFNQAQNLLYHPVTFLTLPVEDITISLMHFRDCNPSLKLIVGSLISSSSLISPLQKAENLLYCYKILGLNKSAQKNLFRINFSTNPYNLIGFQAFQFPITSSQHCRCVISMFSSYGVQQLFEVSVKFDISRCACFALTSQHSPQNRLF